MALLRGRKANSIDAGLREGANRSWQRLGFAVTKWFGSRYVGVGGLSGVETRYERSDGSHGPWTANVRTVLYGDRSFIATVSCSQDAQKERMVEVERIMNSLKIGSSD